MAKKKSDLIKDYEDLKASGHVVTCFTIFEHTEFGTECIISTNPEERIKALDECFNENLVNDICPAIYIEDYEFDIESDTFDFGSAIEAMKAGAYVSRKGWNGKNQFVSYRKETNYLAETKEEELLADEKGNVKLNPFFALRTVCGSLSTWVPSITDCLAEDWYIYND